MKNNTLTYRVGELEKTKDKHNEILYGEHGILTNHIPTIQKDMQKLKTLMTLNIGAIIIGILIAKYL